MGHKRSSGRSGGGEPLLIYGRRAVDAAVRGGRAVSVLYCAAARQAESRAVAEEAARRGVAVRRVDDGQMRRLFGGARHQDIAAYMHPPQTTVDDLTAAAAARTDAKARALLAVDGVTDSRNLGALLRVARAFGAAAVVAPKRNSAPLNSVAAQTSAGAAADVPVARVVNMARALRQIGAAGWQVVGCDEGAAGSIDAAALAPPLCWVLGDEGEGIRRLTREQCDVVARIPTVGGDAGCLSVVTAAAAALAIASSSTATKS